MDGVDLVVIGGGSAGLGFGCSLAGSGLEVVVLERQSRQQLETPSYDGRDLAITHRSKRLLQQLGIWERIAVEEIAPLRQAKVVDGESDYTLGFDTAGRSVEELGYLISNHTIRAATYAQLQQAGAVELCTEVEVEGVVRSGDRFVVTLNGGEQIEARMVVSADTRFSSTRRMMGLSAEMFDFGRTAIVCRVAHDRSHEHTAWECFRYGRTVALLPLNGDRSSVVVTVPTSEVDHYLQMSAEQFAEVLEEGLGGRVGRMQLESDRFSYPLVAVHARRLVADSYALLGDAAVGMHPVTAHGFNLGLRGQNTLATRMKQALQQGRSFHGRWVLDHYDRTQQMASRPIYHGTNSLVRLFTAEGEGAKWLRQAALRVGNHLPPVQWGIVNQLTETGESPLKFPQIPSLRSFWHHFPRYSSR